MPSVTRDASQHDARSSDSADYWTVATTAMRREEAEAAAELITATYPGVLASSINPRYFMSLHMDRWTVQALRDAVALFEASGGDVGSMREQFDEWLAVAEP